MKTKIIPFDLETAKKIQAGEIKGRVLDIDNFEGTIITTEGLNTPLPVVIKFNFKHGDNILFFGYDGKNPKGNKLVFEVPDNESQFKPFDKVLVRMAVNDTWCCAFFSHMNVDTYVCICDAFTFCIPYEGNQELVGTTKIPKDYGDK